MNVRRALAGSTLSLLAVLGTVAPASAADGACDDPAALQASVVAAQVTVTDAKVAFHAANRPLGQLVSAQRHAAKAELTESRAALRRLTAKLTGKQGAEARQAILAQARVERREAAAAQSLLTSKRALLAEKHPAFKEIADERGVSAQQVALAWELAQSPVVIPIPGAKRPSSITDSAAAADLELSHDELKRLDAS